MHRAPRRAAPRKAAQRGENALPVVPGGAVGALIIAPSPALRISVNFSDEKERRPLDSAT